MKNRRGFLKAILAASGVGCGVVVAAKSEARAAAPSASRAALAYAATFRSFDPHLSDDDLNRIARRIDEARAAGATVNPSTKRLRNGDDMVARFSADERVQR